MPGKRVSKYEKEQRIRYIQDWILEEKSDFKILQKIKSEWDLSLSMARKYFKNAYDGFKKDQDIELENKRAAKIATLKKDLRGLSAKYRKTPSGLNAISRMQKLIIRLEGIEPPQRHQIEANVNTVIKPTKYIDATRTGNRDSGTSTSN